MGKTKRGKGTKLMALADSSGLPLSLCVASTSPHEITLVGSTLERSFFESKLQRLIGDRLCDSETLDEQLRIIGIEIIARHRRKNRKKPKTQDGAQAKALQEALESGAPLCLAGELRSSGGSLRTKSAELPVVCAVGLRAHPTQAFMRWIVLISREDVALDMWPVFALLSALGTSMALDGFYRCRGCLWRIMQTKVP